MFADLIDGPLAHLPSGRFAANSAWAICAAITHNLLRAAGTLAGPRQPWPAGATLRRQIVNVPARIAQPQRRPVLHLPAHWPWADALAGHVDRRLRSSGTRRQQPPEPIHRRAGPTGDPTGKESGARCRCWPVSPSPFRTVRAVFPHTAHGAMFWVVDIFTWSPDIGQCL